MAMKSGISLLIGLVVLIRVAALASANAEDWADASAADWSDSVCSGLGLLLSANFCGPSILARAPGRRWRAGSTIPAVRQVCTPAALPVGDSEQADENLFGINDVASLTMESSLPPSEWRLSHPDALGCDSHVNSKTRPPP